MKQGKETATGRRVTGTVEIEIGIKMKDGQIEESGEKET